MMGRAAPRQYAPQAERTDGTDRHQATGAGAVAALDSALGLGLVAGLIGLLSIVSPDRVVSQG